jgi:hypothetical protein
MMKTVAGASPLPKVLREIPSRFTLISRVMFGGLFDMISICPSMYEGREPVRVSD